MMMKLYDLRGLARGMARGRKHSLLVAFVVLMAAGAWLGMLPGMAGAQDVEIERLEPANWWVGFSNPELELLVYGEDLADVGLEVEYPGVRVTEVYRPENPNYLFVTLEIAEDTEPGTMELRFVREGADLIIPYELKERTSDGLRHAGMDASDVIYLLMPDRFANGDPSNDTIDGMLEAMDRSKPGGRHGGDLQGWRIGWDIFRIWG